MMPGPPLVLSFCACGYGLKRESKVFFLLNLQFPVTVLMDKTKLKDRSQRSLEYVVERISAQVPFCFYTCGNRPGERRWCSEVRQLFWDRVGVWIQECGYSVHPQLLFRLRFCIWWLGFLPIAEHFKWVAISSDFCLFNTLFWFLWNDSVGHHWLCSQHMGLF